MNTIRAIKKNIKTTKKNIKKKMTTLATWIKTKYKK